ncbi:hypothetical protein C2S53_001100 [Perilla frutescens var. hirtella]|uniref:SHSP domain-containing protein n=1 Tax=Perilla frutescens var. hirtella TaxID=608512 RepID=A0AAD4NXT5_PERFH|nr:hypothetical protein C2S53_001100 [Perilla frutescens var. hirtella]
MAAKSVDQEIVYEEFEPFCKWQRKEDRDVLEIQLQDFKKEQLKVQISNHGVLKISGERPLDPTKEPTKRSKFYKEVPAPSSKYDTRAIHAKFVSNNLIITLPKPKTSPPERVISPSAPTKIDQTPKPPPPLANIGGNVSMGGQCQLTKCRKQPMFRSRLAKVAASLAATAVAAVVLAAYVHYMYKSCTVDD